ncbi:NAD(P)H-dependent oxidoreductase [Vibrio alfacsensis]|uniref:NAD(P)H-dependent oxidoreductase n=1 Tax=Vibrio alfacsensis TaxID=1074311 RepID=UPI001BF14293|nr:NAD(P)H-dependent oxidoreductase [Vibrio alfacsensis]BCN26555.1 hypothetical protein VYA_37470 [Vibrio alfacsensis]
MSKVLVISGHPNLDASYTNTVILDEIKAGLNDVEVRRLDTLYPNYQIDVEAEQAALLSADVVVLQFPFYWYSSPALLKKWVDDVFSFNFAYGPEGDKLKGKDFMLSFTIGGPAESYDPLGYNHFTIEQFVYPFQQTAYLAGMNYQKPVYTHRMVYIPNVYNKLEEVQARAKDHANRLIAQIEALTSSPESRIQKFVGQWFAKFDLLDGETDFFTEKLAEDVKWLMPEGEFFGHDGFRDWYAIVRNTFKPNCDHDVQQIEVTPNDDGFQVELRILLSAESVENNTMNGEAVHLTVNETWQVTIQESGDITVHEYRVVPVNH